MIPDKVKDFILEYDYFQTPFTISFQRKTAMSSYQGLFFSLIAYGLILFIAINEGEKAFINPFPGIHYYYEAFQESYTKKLDQFPIMISHESISTTDLLYGKFLSIKAYSRRIKINDQNTIERNLEQLNLIMCNNINEEIFISKKISDKEKKFKFLSDQLCIDKIGALELVGTERDIERASIVIEVSKCSKEENPNCLSDAEVKKEIQNRKLKVLLIDSFPIFDNYQEPFSYYIKEEQFYLKFNLLQEQDLFVSNLKIVNRSGFIYPSLSYEYTDHLLNKPDSFISEIDIENPVLLRIIFRLGLFQQTFRRVYLKIQDLLGIIGGFTEIVFIALKLTCGFFNKYLLNQFIINSVVDFEDEREVLMKKRRDGLPKSNDGKVMSIADSILQFQMMNNSSNKDNKNSNNKLSRKQMSKLFKNKLDVKDIDKSLNKISEENITEKSESVKSSLPSPLNSNQISKKNSNNLESNASNHGQGSNRLKNGSNYEIIDNIVNDNKDVRKSNESSKFNLNLNNIQSNQLNNNEGSNNQTYREIDCKDMLKNELYIKPLIGDISKRRGNSNFFDNSNRELKDVEEESNIKEMNKSVNEIEKTEKNKVKKVEIKKDTSEIETKQDKFYISYFDVIGTNIFFCCSKYYATKRETLQKYENVVLEYFDYETVIKEVISFKNYKKHLIEKEQEEQEKIPVSNFFANNEKHDKIVIPKKDSSRKQFNTIISNNEKKSESKSSNSYNSNSKNSSNKSKDSNHFEALNNSNQNNFEKNNKGRKSLSINLNSINGSIKFNLDRFSLSGLHDPKISKSSKGSKMHKQINFGHKITEMTNEFDEKEYDAKKLDESITKHRKSKKNSCLNHLHSIKSLPSNNTNQEITEVSEYVKVSFQDEKINKPNWWDLYNDNIDEDKNENIDKNQNANK